MTRYYYTSAEDKKLAEQSFNNIAWLVFGKNNPDKIEAFMELFESEVKQVNVFPQGTITYHLNDTTPGICRQDKSDKKIIIEMLGYSGSNSDQHSFIQHEATHEFCHSFADLLPMVFSNHPEGIIIDGISCKNSMGLIEETDPETGELVGRHYYGKMFNETMMDIISSMGINSFDSSNSDKTVDDILRTEHAAWGNSKTGYSMFTSLTRLAIAAFSNNGFINYQNIVNSGHGIFDITTRMKNGELYRANDFLYGILFDQLHIQREFDRFMGEGSYRTFCEYLDDLFHRSLGNHRIESDEVKLVMNLLPDFLNRKMNYYIQQGIIDQSGADQIIGNFNQIWNSMQIEYDAYFTDSEISDIIERSGSSSSRTGVRDNL